MAENKSFRNWYAYDYLAQIIGELGSDVCSPLKCSGIFAEDFPINKFKRIEELVISLLDLFWECPVNDKLPSTEETEIEEEAIEIWKKFVINQFKEDEESRRQACFLCDSINEMFMLATR